MKHDHAVGGREAGPTHQAHQAHPVLYPGRELLGLDALAHGVTPETFGGQAYALAWLEAEHQVLRPGSGHEGNARDFALGRRVGVLK